MKEEKDGKDWIEIASGKTDSEGKIKVIGKVSGKEKIDIESKIVISKNEFIT